MNNNNNNNNNPTAGRGDIADADTSRPTDWPSRKDPKERGVRDAEVWALLAPRRKPPSPHRRSPGELSERDQAIVELVERHGSATYTNEEIVSLLGLGCSITRVSVSLRRLEAAGELIVERSAPHPVLNPSGRTLIRANHRSAK